MEPDSRTAPDTCPSSQVGQVLVAALTPGFDPDTPPVWPDRDSYLTAVITRGGFAVAVALILAVLRHLFGQPPDVRAITRRLNEYRNRLPGGADLPMRDIEGQVRGLLGEYWLVDAVNFDRLVAAGPAQLILWRELVWDYLRDTGQDATTLVCAAEQNATPGSLAWQIADRYRSLVDDMLNNPDSPAAQHPGLRAIRDVIEG